MMGEACGKIPEFVEPHKDFTQVEALSVIIICITKM